MPLSFWAILIIISVADFAVGETDSVESAHGGFGVFSAFPAASSARHLRLKELRMKQADYALQYGAIALSIRFKSHVPLFIHGMYVQVPAGQAAASVAHQAMGAPMCTFGCPLLT